MFNHLILILALLFTPVLVSACSASDDTARHTGTAPDTAAVAPAAAVTPALPARPTGTAWIVISKRDCTLSVYDRDASGDTALVAQFPCCMGRNRGDKVRRGDMRTPESPSGKPFRITMIQDASTWKHDFKDGRGGILAYGHWFLRLDTPGHRGIGIHGSTNNEATVPGRASEGCIRLLDKDIVTLKERFAYVNMLVTVLPEGQAPLPWEARARRAAAR